MSAVFPYSAALLKSSGNTGRQGRRALRLYGVGPQHARCGAGGSSSCPEGAQGCSHGCSVPACRDAKPVEVVGPLNRPPRRGGGWSDDNGYEESFAPPGRKRWYLNSTGCAKPTGFAPPVATARRPFGAKCGSPRGWARGSFLWFTALPTSPARQALAIRPAILNDCGVSDFDPTATPSARRR